MVTTYARRILDLFDVYKAKELFTTSDDMKLIDKYLGLNEMETELELRNMRDIVVLLSQSMMDSANYDGDKERFMQVRDNMWSVTATIDSVLVRKGYGV